MAQAPANCPGEEDTSALYDAEDILLAKIAAQVEQSGYGKHTRVEEIMDFAVSYTHLACLLNK